MSDVQTRTIETKIPARMDRMPWAKFHWLVVIGLGTVWILDGLEVTMVGSVASRMTEDGSGIDISSGQIGIAAAFYVAGACLGALLFGQLTDMYGRKKLFLITLAVYITATTATAFSFAPWYFFAMRFFTGAGIGGEYAAINSAIDELIPARVRGRVDLTINGSYWLGSMGGAALALVFLDQNIFATNIGWRLAFGVGAVLGLLIMVVRRHVPESPRWLFIHGREEEAEKIVSSIEEGIEEETGDDLPDPEQSIKVRQRERIPFKEIAKTAFKLYPRRAWLGFMLFVGQAFIYNGVTFNLGTLYTTFFDVSSSFVPVLIIIWAFGNFLGPLTLGRLFDTVGRKPMISGCYLGSAALAGLLGVLFWQGALGSKWWFEALIVATFFLASAGASAAYLTVSEIFPMETRALAIAFFYAIGTAVGGITGPLIFGQLIGSGERLQVAVAMWIGTAVMAMGGIAELFLGVKAEQQSLEDIAKPMTVDEAEEGGAEGEGEEGDGEEIEASPRVLELRRDAEEARAAAAEHRAKIHELEAEHDDADVADRVATEEVLARVADLRADALHLRADAQEVRDDAGDEDDPVSLERAQALEERANAVSEQSEALVAESDDETHLHEHLARAAQERAEAAQERARVAELRRRSEKLDEQASEKSDQDEAKAQARERRRRQEEDEARVRQRLERRVARDRQGLQRFKPGPGTGAYGGGMLSVRPDALRDDEELDREIEMIERALREHGQIDRGELERAIGARFWGPGRFRTALREAVDEGRAERFSRSTYGPPR